MKTVWSGRSAPIHGTGFLTARRAGPTIAGAIARNPLLIPLELTLALI
jgi:hypothetical protein